MRQESMNRRTFLATSAHAAAGLSAVYEASGPVLGALGANDRVRVACVGINGRGVSHIQAFLSLNSRGVDLVALCDVDEQVLNTRTAEVEKQSGKKPATHRDIRKLLEDRSIDAVSIATPNHWHALATIWACQAGKDVYVEKPASWCIREGRKMVEAARKHRRIVQVGMQARSFSHVRRAMDQMHAGLIGDLYMARALCYKRRDSIGFKSPAQPPANLDFDLWLGPAQKQPYHANLVHYNWHWFWNFGNGDLGNQGVHEVDLARWALNRDLPIKVTSAGGRFGYKDQGQTPNTQIATCTYEDGTMIVCDVRGRYSNAEKGVQIGNLFYGSEGFLPAANWGGPADSRPHQNQTEGDWRPKYGYGGAPFGGKQAGQDTAKAAVEGERHPIHEQDLDHYENFIAAVRSRRIENLTCDVLEGHRSAMLVHAANIAYRLGRTLTFDPKTEIFVGDGADQANTYLTRDYREPFVVRETV